MFIGSDWAGDRPTRVSVFLWVMLDGLLLSAGA